MNKKETKKQLLLEKMSSHILSHGLKSSSLKSLAASAGTSDRMLLHYFRNKDELLSSVLDTIYNQFIAILSIAQAEKVSGPQMILHLTALMKHQAVRPYIQFWFELVPYAVKKEAPFHLISRKICDRYFTWIKHNINAVNETEQKQIAALVLSLTEGFALFDMLGEELIITNALAGMDQFFNLKNP